MRILVSMKILLAEDDKDMARGLCTLLRRSNYMVDVVENGRDALDYLMRGDCDMAILDVMMPEMDGMTVLKTIRHKGLQTPVMMLTALGETTDKIAALDDGADDYLVKPFDMGELLARVRALLRRRENFIADVISFGDLQLDRKKYVLSTKKGNIGLNNKAFQMMEMFMLSPGQILSAAQMMEHIWGWNSESEINVVWVNISMLRKNLKKLESEVIIRAVRGAGYSLEKKYGSESSY